MGKAAQWEEMMESVFESLFFTAYMSFEEGEFFSEERLFKSAETGQRPTGKNTAYISEGEENEAEARRGAENKEREAGDVLRKRTAARGRIFENDALAEEILMRERVREADECLFEPLRERFDEEAEEFFAEGGFEKRLISEGFNEELPPETRGSLFREETAAGAESGYRELSLPEGIYEGYEAESVWEEIMKVEYAKSSGNFEHFEKGRIQRILTGAGEKSGETRGIRIEKVNNNISSEIDIDEVIDAMTMRITDLMTRSADGIY